MVNSEKKWLKFQKQVGAKFKQKGWTVSVDENNTQKRKGITGEKYQIDIIAKKKSEPILKFLVECKDRNRNVEKGEVREFCKAVSDIPFYQGILVTSQKGVEEGAKKALENEGIYHYKLSELEDFLGKVLPSGFEPLEKSLQRSRNPRVPRKDDFEQGKVFIDKEKQQIIRDWLADPEIPCSLLYGESGSGKTIFALGVGYNLKAEGDMQEVFYLDLVRTESIFRNLAHSLTSNDQSNLLFIIDNCHSKPDIAEGLARVAQEQLKEARVLFISRPKGKAAFEEETEYFDQLSGVSLQLVADELTFRGIIQGFAKGDIGVTNVPEVMKICKSNLYLLSLLLEDWDGITPLDSLGRKLLKKVFNRYSPQIENQVLPRLSVLYQFEMPLPYKLVQKWDILEDVNRLIDDGIVERRLLSNGSNYFLPHSAFAEVILETAQYHGIISRTPYEKEICKEYIQLQPPYLNYFLADIHNSGRDDLLSYLLETTDWFNLLKDGYWEPETPIFWFMLGRVLLSANTLELSREIVWKNILKEGTVNQLARKIEKANIFSLRALIQQLIKFDKDYAGAFVKNLPHQPVLESFQQAGIGTGLSFLVLLGRLKQDDLKAKCLSKLADEMRTKPFSIQTLFWRLRDWISEDKDGAAAFVKELGEKFWEAAFEQADIQNKLHLVNIFSKTEQDKLVAYLISVWPKEHIIEDIQSANLTNFSFFLVTLSSVNRSLCNSLLDKIIPKRLAKVIKDKDPTVLIVRDVLKYGRPKFRKEFLQAFKQHELLAIFVHSNLAQIGYLMRYYGKYPPLWKAYKIFEHKHLKTAFKQTSLEDIQRFIRNIPFSRDKFLPPRSPQLQYAQNALQKLQQIDLRGKLEIASLHDLAGFLWNIFVVDSTQAARYNLVICRLDLKSKFKESKLHEINFFLWNLYETSLTLPQIFQDGKLRSIVAYTCRQEPLIKNLLETIGIFEIVGCPILEQEIAKPRPSTAGIRDYLEGQIDEFPFSLMRVLKGLEVIGEDWVKQFFLDNIDLTQRLIHFLEKGIKLEMTKKTKQLHTECLAFLLSKKAINETF